MLFCLEGDEIDILKCGGGGHGNNKADASAVVLPAACASWYRHERLSRDSETNFPRF